MTRDVPFYCNNEDPEVVRLFVIRHGQTEHNVMKILQGHLDTDLNETGREQARKLGEYLGERGIEFDSIASSDLKRCKQTVDEIMGVCDRRPPVKCYKELRERCMGVIEGMRLSDAEKYAETHGKGSFRDFGEKPDEFLARLTSGINSIAESAAECGRIKNMAVVSHGGAIRTLLRWLHYEEHNAHNIIVFNTSVTIIDYFKHTRQYVVRRVGNTQHLGDGEFIVSDLKLR
ncbi:hypothetical protein HG537_0C01630 [Torulaspora globosa]|uniref:Phosphoglycerate mutase-like protein n=1 Tax=Torulaspora globosa TaxID=48254 RepID=A0A7H9HQN0_9SACH|nr:hypothetical protein HG537_0C01630 [Torulaspora sp. CBS 2947]